MDDIVSVVTKVEDDTDQGGKAYKRVTLGTGQVLKVKQGRDQVLMAKWGILEEGVAVIFKMAEFTNPEGVKFPFVKDIVKVADELQPPKIELEPTILPEHQEEIEKAKVWVKEEPPPNPQSVGMATKEIGALTIAKYLIPIFGEEAGNELIKWYRSQILGIARVPFDGDKLPKFEKKGE